MKMMMNQKYADIEEDHMQSSLSSGHYSDDENDIYEKCAYVEDKPSGYRSDDDTRIYYLKEHILLYEGCNLVAEIIKDHLGRIIQTKQILQHHHHHHQYPAVSVSSSDNDSKPAETSRKRPRTNLDDQQVEYNQEKPPIPDDFLASITRKARTTRTPIIRDLLMTHQQNNNHHHDQEMVINNNNNDDDQLEEEEEEGRGILFIEKVLKSTDVSDHHHRLSVSCKQAINDTFLTNEELEIMKKRGAVKAVLTDPAGREYDVRLQIEKTGTGCECYKIPKPWNLIKKENKIKEGMIIQLWASRPNRSDLCFNLVRKLN